MHQPQQGDNHGGTRRRGAQRARDARTGQRPPDDAEEQERAGDVERDVDGVIARHVQAAEGVVDGERDVDERATRDRRFAGRRERIR
jgi:hypothetical protein